MNDQFSADEQDGLLTRRWDVPWHAHLFPVALAGLISAISLTFAANERMTFWTLSWAGFEHGNGLPLILHIFAHGSLLHLLLNCAALLLLSGPLISRLGSPPVSWARYFYLFIGSGLCGGAMFLVLNSTEAASMLGASGAIFGVLGALARVHPGTGEAVPMTSPRTWMLVKFFVQNHAALFVLLALVALVTGRWAFLAWEAHLGGLLFGFFAAPLFLPRRAD